MTCHGDIDRTVGTLFDRAVMQGGSRVAVAQGSRTYTYTELGGVASRLTAALQSVGIDKGDRVALLMPNRPEYIACEYAVAKAGATRVPLACALGVDDHIYMLNRARCKLLIYDQRFTDRVCGMVPQLESLERYICVGDDASRVAAGHVLFQTLIDSEFPAARHVDVDGEDIAGIYFTGGTTGRPKGVMLSHRALWFTYQAEMLEFDIGWHEIFVVATPMTHASGYLVMPVLVRAGKCVLLEQFAADLLLQTIAAERGTMTFLVPTMIYALLDHPHDRALDLSSLTNVIYGAATISPERLRQALRLFGGVFTQLFGQTEAPMAILALPREAHCVEEGAMNERILASAGRATLQTELRLLDDGGKPVKAGTPGEIAIRAPNMMSGYLDDPEATNQAIRAGWLHTGDIATMDDKGFITIVDRKKDIIISGGFNISPREIEDVLAEHPAVRQAVVVGVPDERWGEQVKAIVVLYPGRSASASELIAFVKARKGSVIAPKTLEFWESIPLTNLGKLDRKSVRAKFWHGRQRQV